MKFPASSVSPTDQPMDSTILWLSLRDSTQVRFTDRSNGTKGITVAIGSKNPLQIQIIHSILYLSW